MEYRIIERFGKYELQQKYSYFDSGVRQIKWAKCCRGSYEFCNNVYKIRTQS